MSEWLNDLSGICDIKQLLLSGVNTWGVELQHKHVDGRRINSDMVALWMFSTLAIRRNISTLFEDEIYKSGRKKSNEVCLNNIQWICKTLWGIKSETDIWYDVNNTLKSSVFKAASGYTADVLWHRHLHRKERKLTGVTFVDPWRCHCKKIHEKVTFFISIVASLINVLVFPMCAVGHCRKKRVK